MSESPDQPTVQRRPGLAMIVVGGLVIALAAGVVGGIVGASATRAQTNAAVAARSSSGCDATWVAAKVLPSIVTIQAQSANAKEAGTGSGEIVRADGTIVTNNHVISVAADGGRITVLMNSGETLAAELVGRDPLTDLAVLRVHANHRLPVLAYGDSTALKVGDGVVALGAPLGLSGTVTAGIVSALNRTVQVPQDGDKIATLTDVVQTDASINPGNSGGALTNCQGRLVGVNTAIATVPNEAGQAGGGSVGIGFAVPETTVQKITEQLIANGSVSRPVAGLSTAFIAPDVAKQFGTVSGLFVQEVTAGGPAAAAGLQQGDIITRVNDHAAGQETVANLSLTLKAGDVVTVTFVRDGTTRTTKLTLAAE